MVVKKAIHTSTNMQLTAADLFKFCMTLCYYQIIKGLLCYFSLVENVVHTKMKMLKTQFFSLG